MFDVFNATCLDTNCMPLICIRIGCMQTVPHICPVSPKKSELLIVQLTFPVEALLTLLVQGTA